MSKKTVNGIARTSGEKAIGEIKKNRFNLLDFIAILLVLAIIALIVYILVPWNNIWSFITDDDVSITYTLEFKGVDASFVDTIEDGDSVLNLKNKSELGVVTKVDENSSMELVLDEQNVGKLIPVEGRYDIVVNITSKANFEQGKGYTINGCRIAVGEQLSVLLPNYSGEGFCVSIQADNNR